MNSFIGRSFAQQPLLSLSRVAGSLGLVLCSGLMSCSPPDASTSQSNPQPDAPESTVEANESENGSLTLTANGEDFVRQGFVSKDDWAIAFDHVYITVTEATAYQTDPAYDAKASNTVDPATVTAAQPLIETPTAIDLAEGDAEADPIAVTTKTAPTGRYNALDWLLAPDKESGNDYAIQLLGTATKGDRTIQFDIGLDPTYRYTCGEFIGDSRKGILQPEQSAELEMTLHFDHIFGDGDAPDDDEINTGALGFEPLAAIAEGDSLTTDLAALQSSLSPEEGEVLAEAIAGLGHVGEGHCALTES